MYVCVYIYIYIYIYVCGGYLDKFISAATGSPQTKIPSSALDHTSGHPKEADLPFLQRRRRHLGSIWTHPIRLMNLNFISSCMPDD